MSNHHFHRSAGLSQSFFHLGQPILHVGTRFGMSTKRIPALVSSETPVLRVLRLHASYLTSPRSKPDGKARNPGAMKLRDVAMHSSCFEECKRSLHAMVLANYPILCCCNCKRDRATVECIRLEHDRAPPKSKERRNTSTNHPMHQCSNSLEFTASLLIWGIA